MNNNNNKDIENIKLKIKHIKSNINNNIVNGEI